MTQRTGRRRPADIPTNLSQITWDAARAPVHRALLWAIKNYSGIPGGFFGETPQPIAPNAGSAGTEVSGWAAADHEHDGRHVLLDALLHTDTVAASPTDGAIIRGNGVAWAVAEAVTVFDECEADGSAGFLNVIGTLPAGDTPVGALVDVAGSGSAATFQAAIAAQLSAGYTGPGRTVGAYVSNTSPGTGTNPVGTGAANFGIEAFSTGLSAGTDVAVQGYAENQGSGDSYGGVFAADIGGLGAGNKVGLLALGGGAGTGHEIGGLFSLGAGLPTMQTGVIVADNKAAAVPILIATDNGSVPPTTGPTATVCIQDGATMQYGLGVLTNGTLVPTAQGRMSGSLLHAYPWTNAQIVALGAVTAGNIAAFTLPAKTVVKNAYLVLTGQGAGVTTLTVAVGRVTAAYDDYVVASDAKAVPGTVYGDAAAERGVNMTGFDLPNYAGTTLVNLHFISTGGNLSAVTGSSGIVIIETALLP